ncbi:MAG: hypothetical protein PHV13_01560 [Candidatus ainarchaeum sp.]|nr:hypothetical protein [Candidatus ainarchaeum sp.]
MCTTVPAAAFVAFLLLAPLAFAQEADKSGLGTGFDKLSSALDKQKEDFVYGASSFGRGLSTVPGNLLDAFGKSSCEDPWAVGGVNNSYPAIGLWLAPAVAVGFIVMIGVAIIYMLGQFFSSPNLIAIAKDEGFQTALTFLRVLFIIGMMLGANMWFSLSAPTSDPIYSQNPQMIDASMAFSRLMVSDMVTHYSMLVMYNTVIHTIYSSTMWIGVTWRAMYSINLGPVLKPIIDLVGTSLQFLSLGMTEWLMHVITLCMIKKYMWSFFIPIGMLLRAFPYTRNAGEALLALAFALVIFYPLMFLFSYEAHKILSYNLVDAKNAMGNFLNKSGILAVFGPALVVMFLMAGVFMPFFLGGALTLAFELIKGAVYYIVIMSVFLPFLNLFVTLTAAKETAKFFNVDVNFMSFLKII